ncbi:hypothetical protein PR048_008907, partial [Dryococelus australis]
MQTGKSYLQDHPEVVPDEAENLTHISESNDNGNVPKPTTSRGQVSLNLIKPFPVANRPRDTKRKRTKNVSASILTSTPVKDFLLKNQPALCPGCEGEFVDPPDKEWMKCGTCEQWWHEKCSSYEGFDQL